MSGTRKCISVVMYHFVTWDELSKMLTAFKFAATKEVVLQFVGDGVCGATSPSSAVAHKNEQFLCVFTDLPGSEISPLLDA